MSRNWFVALFSIVAAVTSARGQDCNTNGVDDADDIAGGRSQDCNATLIPDECETFAAVGIRALRIAPTFSYPVGIYQAPGDAQRFYVVEKNLGTIRLIKNGTLQATPFLNIRTLITNSGERGFLSAAFHPQYQTNGHFFVYYTNTSGNVVIARYTRDTANPDIANPSSAVILKTIVKDFANHNGGQLQFGPDGYLYAGIGDGGDGDDPNNNAQDINNLQGKMLRLDVDNPPTYVPTTNPYVGIDGLDEIWDIGVRNPWRFSFDRLTGDIYIADVGQGSREEIDFEPAGSAGNINYGWDCREGFICSPGNNGGDGCSCTQGGLTDPILDISHSDSGTCSITGGYVYRGCAIPSEHGNYFFADYCGGYIRSFHYEPGNAIPVAWQARTSQLSGIMGQVVSFGEDLAGELYICTSGGNIYKIVPATCPASTALGDVDRDCDMDLADFADFMACIGTTGGTCGCFDIDSDGDIDLSDYALLAGDQTGPGTASPSCIPPV
jgi:glucose/arabinose dehydrogenase